MKSIGGLLLLRKADEYDYPWREVLHSALDVCDRIFCSISSDDSVTPGQLPTNSKIRVLTYPWPNPVNDERWFSKWIQWTRERADTDLVFFMDADEILEPEDKQKLCQHVEAGHTCLSFERYQFAIDPQHLYGVGPNSCGHESQLRICPKDWFLPNHGDDTNFVRFDAWDKRVLTDIRLYHYTLLRNPQAYHAKAHDILRMHYGGDYSSSVIMNSKNGEWVLDQHQWFPNGFLSFQGTHPAIIKPWLKERGYAV
jgi:hypothetical protein